MVRASGELHQVADKRGAVLITSHRMAIADHHSSLKAPAWSELFEDLILREEIRLGLEETNWQLETSGLIAPALAQARVRGVGSGYAIVQGKRAEAPGKKVILLRTLFDQLRCELERSVCMADNKSKRGTGDRSRVAGDGYELRYFARRRGLSGEQARQLIAEIWNDRDKLNAAAAKLEGARSKRDR